MTAWLAWSLSLACNQLGIGDGCLTQNLDLWCTHSESEEGPTDRDAVCDPPDGEPGYRCGDYDIIAESGGFTGVTHFLDAETGEHVASKFWTDINTYCGDFSYWYGKRIDCEPVCTYDHDDTSDLPLCD